MGKVKIAILASGSGSNAEAIIKWAKTSEIAEVVCVLSNRRDALVLNRAFNYNIEAFSVLKRKNEEAIDYDKRLAAKLQEFSPDFIVLAGFMRLLSSDFLKTFNYNIINIHPSLLPLFPGMDGYGDAFKAGVSESGCTVHYVDEGMDTGKIIAQKKFPLIAGESFEDFKKRGLAIENKFYPEVLEKLLLSKGLL
jgi:phosphoribosylglycinamide formyltransferase-1